MYRQISTCVYKYIYIYIHIYTTCTRSEKPSQETDILKSQLANKIVIHNDNKANVWEFLTCATRKKSEKEPWRPAFCSTARKNEISPKNAPVSIVLRVLPLCTARKRPSSMKYSVLDSSPFLNTASPGCNERRVMRWKHICRACSPVDGSCHTCGKMCMCHGMHVNESCRTCKAHINESHHTCEAHVDESCHTCGALSFSILSL